ncbi:hypothetical protein CPI00_27515, partial [Klebsiella pneumoniae subsp. pneumoniae]|nr:hypothetical protein [Klebsiella pneumoniae subsp. pneumoniae]
MSSKKTLLSIALLPASITALSCCQSNADQYAAYVYDAGQLNAKQETKTVNIISVLPEKVAVDNTANKQAEQTFGAILGAVVGGVAGHNVGSSSGDATQTGTAACGAV